MDDLQRSLLGRDRGVDRPTLENRVAFQWDRPQDLLAYRNATRRDSAVLGWVSDCAAEAGYRGEVLDIGCSYGNYLLMLNAMLEKNPGIRYHGVDIDEDRINYGQDFAKTVPGYQNCAFLVHDVEVGLPFKDEQFIAVVLADVIEHLEDPSATLKEIRRVLVPGGSLIVSTPLRTSAFKRASRLANRLSRNRLNARYYAGKDTELDTNGQPAMETNMGHDHINEMLYPELIAAASSAGFSVRSTQFMGVMSGSRWFDSHPMLQWTLLGVEAVHDRLQRPSWAHGVCLRLRRTET